MTIYKRVSVEEREAMKEGVILGKTQSDIAKELNRNKSTISRELRRIWLPKELYSPVAADADAKKNNRPVKLAKKKSKGSLQITSKTIYSKSIFLLSKLVKCYVDNFQMILQ